MKALASEVSGGRGEGSDQSLAESQWSLVKREREDSITYYTFHIEES